MKDKKKTEEAGGLRCIKGFDIYLPIVPAHSAKDPQLGAIEKDEQINADIITTDQILSWSHDVRERLRTELENVLRSTLSKMPEKEYRCIVESYFRQPGRKFHRQALLFRNEAGTLIATALLDQGEIEYKGKIMKGIYHILRVILPKYQGLGLGQTIAAKVLMELQPDVLFVTAYQSSSVHSWVSLPQKGSVTGFEVYPRIEQKNGKDLLITLPYKDLDFAIRAFKQTRIGYLNSYQELEKDVNNLTVHMVRKNTHGEVYDFNPWAKNGREDKLAEALDVTAEDGILIMFRKILV